MKINLVNLHEGLNQLSFRTRPEELQLNEKEETRFMFPNDIYVNVGIQKFSDKYYIKADMHTLAHYTCDRCLDEFDRNLESTFELVYSKQTQNHVADEDYRFVGKNVIEIDLSSDVRDNLILVIPMKNLCREDCSGLCPHCGVNSNFETCNCEQNAIDPRWEKLKGLR